MMYFTYFYFWVNSHMHNFFNKRPLDFSVFPQSSLLMAILSELQASSGSVSVKGKVAYVSQQPWVFSGSMRQNILFGSQYDKGRFDRVIRASALHKVSVCSLIVVN